MINDKENFHQKVLFDGIRYGGCMPTDIDAALEFGGKVLVLYELKYGNARVPKGQMLLLKRLVDAWAKDGKQAVLFICRHNTPSKKDILLKESIVTDIYYNGRTVKATKPKTAEQQTMDFLRFTEVIA